MSAFPPKANIRPRDRDVCFGPTADISVKVDMSAPNSAADATEPNELAASSEPQVNVCPSITGRTDCKVGGGRPRASEHYGYGDGPIKVPGVGAAREFRLPSRPLD